MQPLRHRVDEVEHAAGEVRHGERLPDGGAVGAVPRQVPGHDLEVAGEVTGALAPQRGRRRAERRAQDQQGVIGSAAQADGRQRGGQRTSRARTMTAMIRAMTAMVRVFMVHLSRG
ncbi:hypothetical protein GCM10012276_18320 [Nocardioides deserti]|nr:hypothetical protein GCM10012276_18320 [Nocardioides deserti]